MRNPGHRAIHSASPSAAPTRPHHARTPRARRHTAIDSCGVSHMDAGKSVSCHEGGDGVDSAASRCPLAHSEMRKADPGQEGLRFAHVRFCASRSIVPLR